ncbi:hypothetical protein A9R05_33040 (plasmid) [Burkholderia sp. KK1]|nr:hypothetical protein A9R05_33040 [Burkholderia sp. KK1]
MEFMEKLRTVDAVILLLTPEYKLRVDDRKGGVYIEYSEIIRRYEELIADANNLTSTITVDADEDEFPYQSVPAPFAMIPLIFSGSYERSCPSDIAHNICVNFGTYRANRNKDGQLCVTPQVASRYAKDISRITNVIFTHYAEKTPEVKQSFEEYLSAFFRNTKREHLQKNPLFESAVERVFVKTFAYKKIRDQTSYLLVGRKGSGKSTIVDYLARETDEKYGHAIDINVNNFHLEFLYTIASSAQSLSDIDMLVEPARFFELVWELFIYLCCIDLVVSEHREAVTMPGQAGPFAVLSRLLDDIAGDHGTERKLNYVAAYRWCYVRVLEQVNETIDKARKDAADFTYDLTRFTEPENVLRASLTKECFEAFNRILLSRSKRFLISFDGFDTAFEEFRVTTQRIADASARQKRTLYELNWLKGFAHIAMEMKSSPTRTPLCQWIDFCATIPKDRFMEIRNDERDSFVYIGKVHEIRWSAIELCILLSKRLEVHYGKADRRTLTPQERLSKILKSRFPYIPLQTITNVDGRDYSLPIFIDVLRHTFWRPREILIYFAKIIVVLKDLHKRNIDSAHFAVSKCISDTTREIIKTEFLSEFQRHCLNLSDIITRFRRFKQIMEMSDIEHALGGCPFKFVDHEVPCLDLSVNLRFLYEVGFLGLEADSRITKRLHLLNMDIFWFNAGDEPFDVMRNEGFENCRFIIHPIFCEFLDLDVSQQHRRLTLDYDWDYLHKQEVHVIAPE